MCWRGLRVLGGLPVRPSPTSCLPRFSSVQAVASSPSLSLPTIRYFTSPPGRSSSSVIAVKNDTEYLSSPRKQWACCSLLHSKMVWPMIARCFSNRKSPTSKGSVADVQIHNNKSFAELCKALLIAERRAREEVELRSKKEEENKEEKLSHKDTQQRAGTILAAQCSAAAAAAADVQINNNKSLAELCKDLLIAERRAREEVEMRSTGAERWAPPTDLHMPATVEDFEREEKSSYF